MTAMRFTIVDDEGTVTFLAPPHAMKMLAAACSRNPTDLRGVLQIAEEYDPRLFGMLLGSLDGTEAQVASQNAEATDGESVVRVADDASRRLSTEPTRYGLVVYNLPARRIVQVQNSYGELQRSDRGRLRRDGRPVRAYYRYALPDEWSIVP